MKNFLLLTVAIASLSACGSDNTPEVEVETAPKWEYTEATDEMRGTTVKAATTTSVEEFVDLFENNATPTTLYVQKRGNKLEVYLHNPNLQYVCSDYLDTYINVKFDNGPIKRYSCATANSNEYGLLSIISANDFVSKVNRSTTVTIETEVFQRGMIQQKFKLVPVSWK
jgi:hypothetical protein